MDSNVERLVATLRDRIGDGLRSVFYGNLREREYTAAYTTETALEGYSPENIDDVVRDVSFEKLDTDRKSDLHEPLGRYTATIEVFDHGVNLVVLGYDDEPTIFVGMDGDVSNVTPALEAVGDVLGEG